MSWLSRRREARLRRLLAVMPGPTEPGVRGWRLILAAGLGFRDGYPLLGRLVDEGLATRWLETDEEVPPGGTRGVRWRLTPRGVWRRGGLA